MTATTADSLPSEPVVRETRPMDSKIELAIHLPPSLVYFQGHFPDFAILPGVAQIDWALLLARRYLDMPAGATRTMRVKFVKPIRPDADLTLTLDYDRPHRLLHFEYRDRDYTYGTGRIEIEGNGV